MKNTNKPRIKTSTRENTYLFVQKISEARLIGYKDNTPTHINDLNTEKAKGQINLDVGLSGFIRSKVNSDIASKITKSSFVPTTEEFNFCKLYITLALLTSSFFFLFLINLRILLFNKSDYFFYKNISFFII